MKTCDFFKSFLMTCLLGFAAVSVASCLGSSDDDDYDGYTHEYKMVFGTYAATVDDDIYEQYEAIKAAYIAGLTEAGVTDWDEDNSNHFIVYGDVDVCDTLVVYGCRYGEEELPNITILFPTATYMVWNYTLGTVLYKKTFTQGETIGE